MRSIERLLNTSQSTKTARNFSPRHCREAFALPWEACDCALAPRQPSAREALSARWDSVDCWAAPQS
eukprot:15456852-Alexandrium_andersonii.AAC.1